MYMCMRYIHPYYQFTDMHFASLSPQMTCHLLGRVTDRCIRFWVKIPDKFNLFFRNYQRMTGLGRGYI